MLKRLFLFCIWPVLGGAVVYAAMLVNGLRSTETNEPETRASVPAALVARTAPAPVRPADGNNPTVPAGKVRWHASFADAQGAAQRSGKPVLLFHMMGQLDRQFC